MQTFRAFLAMGGYATYVWTSYLLAVFALLLPVAFTWRDQRRTWKKISSMWSQAERTE